MADPHDEGRGDDRDGLPRVGVTVLDPPDVTGLAVRVEPPAYSGLEPVLRFDRDVEVLAGSPEQLQLTVDGAIVFTGLGVQLMLRGHEGDPAMAGVCAAMLALFQLDWIAGAMFVPYLVWVTIAAALNFSVWRRNEDVHAQPAA